jgi:hypothetical protein
MADPLPDDLMEALMVDRRWSRTRLATHLAVLFRGTFCARRRRRDDELPAAEHLSFYPARVELVVDGRRVTG